MRLVIDMQGAQSRSRTTEIGQYTLAITKALARTRSNHQVILALSGLLPESIEYIRGEFDDLLSQQDICVWHAVGPVNSSVRGNETRRDAAEQIREAFLANLRPDVVLVPSFFEGFLDDGTISVGSYTTSFPVAACIQSLPPAQEGGANTPRQIYALRKLESLRRAEALISLGPDSPESICAQLGVPQDRVIHAPLHGETEVAIRDDFELQVAKLWVALEQLERGADKRDQPAIRYRPKLAYVSPLPPERSGISDYSAELLPALSRHYAIDVVISQEAVTNPWINANCGVRSVEWFRQNAHCYERVLYHFGNSHYHEHMFSMLRDIPGVIVVHDFFLGDVQWYREAYGIAKNEWTASLYTSHGYVAMTSRFPGNNVADSIKKYPGTLGLIQKAQGVIVHSDYSRQLARLWYGDDASAEWAVIPHLRTAGPKKDCASARKELALPNDAFVVCSFGFIGAAKLNHKLLQAWLASHLSKSARCILVFVGENDPGEYGKTLEQAIQDSGLDERIRITGWADMDAFRSYLSAADLAVQLRTQSRGETSGTVLDCMNHGIATIVNANGAFAELPSDAAWILPDQFSDHELVEALNVLWQDKRRRAELGSTAQKVIQAHHSPSFCAAQYAAHIERSLERFKAQDERPLLEAIAYLDHGTAPLSQVARLARSVTRSLAPRPPIRTLYIDLSATCRTDLKTGVERVARAITLALLKAPPAGYRVEPVYLSDEGGWHYRHARQYTMGMLGCPIDTFSDEPACPQNGDIVVGLDISGDMLVQAEESGLFRDLRADGVKVVFMVHDLLPLTLPETFPPGANLGFARWLHAATQMDCLVCPTKVVAEELQLWVTSNTPPRPREVRIYWSHHGADLKNTAPTTGVPPEAQSVFSACTARPTFLVVGTIEPRKGYQQTLAAFTQLWEQGVDINLIVVGKEGWLNVPVDMRRDIPETAKQLRSHRELGTRLFWLNGISDEYLEKVYAASDCLILPSYGEGFGLPLIEAALNGLPVIARDLPVFRELAADSAHYFRGLDPAQLAGAIRVWLSGPGATGQKYQCEVKFLSWDESAYNLFNLAVTREVQSTDHAGQVARPPEQENTIYVDVSVVCRSDHKTGIQRVVRSLYSTLINKPPHGHRVRPVFLENGPQGWGYRFAENSCHDFPQYRSDARSLELNCIRQGDVFLGLDLAAGWVVPAAKEGLYSAMHDAGAEICFVVYDILPAKYPEYFKPEDADCFREWLRCIRKFDAAVCISASVARDLRAYLNEGHKSRSSKIRIEHFHLGADIASSLPTKGMPESSRSVLEASSLRPTFLMVGTLEPRKGHELVLSTFEHLWSSGFEANLIIVGKLGWNAEFLKERLTNSPKRNTRLFWLEGVSDEYLEAVYGASTCLIAASEDEGFGLPLIEAAHYQLPIIARDIPVFREVAGQHAHYFGEANPQALAKGITDWMDLYKSGRHPVSSEIRALTWDESAEQLLSALLYSDHRPRPTSNAVLMPGKVTSHASQSLDWSGFSQPESEFRWSDGETASITFKLGRPVEAGFLYLEFDTLDRQRMTVLLNDQEVSSGELDGHSIRLLIPTNGFLAADNVIGFKLPDARLPGNGDGRKLGIALRELGIVPCFHIDGASPAPSSTLPIATLARGLYQLTIQGKWLGAASVDLLELVTPNGVIAKLHAPSGDELQRSWTVTATISIVEDMCSVKLKPCAAEHGAVAIGDIRIFPVSTTTALDTTVMEHTRIPDSHRGLADNEHHAQTQSANQPAASRTIVQQAGHLKPMFSGPFSMPEGVDLKKRKLPKKRRR